MRDGELRCIEPDAIPDFALESSLARSMLARSMSNSAFDFARSFGRKATLAFHLRKRPSTLTPSCFATKRISLLSKSTSCACTGCAAATSAARQATPEPSSRHRDDSFRPRLGQHAARASRRARRSDARAPPRHGHRPPRTASSSIRSGPISARWPVCGPSARGRAAGTCPDRRLARRSTSCTASPRVG